MRDRAGEARGRPHRHRRCRADRHCGWPIGHVNGEVVHRSLIVYIVGGRQLDCVSAAGREGVVDYAAGNGRSVGGADPICRQTAKVAHAVLELPGVRHVVHELPWAVGVERGQGAEGKGKELDRGPSTA